MTIQKNLKNVKIADIALDYDLYPRQTIIASRVVDLEQVLEEKGKFKDPIVVAQIQGRDGYVLVDGAHRREVYIKKGIKTVEAEDLGVLTKKQIIIEGFEINNAVSMLISRTDKRIAATKMLKLGMSNDEVHRITGINDAIMRSLSGIVYKNTDGHLAHIPQAFTQRDNDSGMIHLRSGITQSDVQKHADLVEQIPRNFAPKAAIRHLQLLLDYDWLDLVKDVEARRLAKKLYTTIGEVLKDE